MPIPKIGKVGDVIGGIQKVMDGYKLNTATIQVEFAADIKENANFFADDYQRAHISAFRTHSDVQPRVCTKANVQSRVTQLLEAGSWLAQYRAVCLLGSCKNDTENQCRHGAGCSGCPQLYLIDGNHRYSAIMEIRSMLEKPEETLTVQWETFRDPDLHIPVDIYHSVPGPLVRLVAFCATEIQAKSMLNNSNTDTLNFACEMFTLTEKAGVHLTNDVQVATFLKSTQVNDISKQSGKVIMWFFRIFRALPKMVRTLDIGGEKKWRPLPVLDEANAANNLPGEFNRWIQALDTFSVPDFFHGLHLQSPVEDPEKYATFIPQVRYLQPLFSKAKGLPTLAAAQQFLLWLWINWIRRISQEETDKVITPVYPDIGRAAPSHKHWEAPMELTNISERICLVNVLRDIHESGKSKGVPEEVTSEHLLDWNLRYKQCWVFSFSEEDCTDLKRWAYKWKVYAGKELAKDDENQRTMEKLMADAPTDITVHQVPTEEDFSAADGEELNIGGGDEVARDDTEEVADTELIEYSDGGEVAAAEEEAVEVEDGADDAESIVDEGDEEGDEEEGDEDADDALEEDDGEESTQRIASRNESEGRLRKRRRVSYSEDGKKSRKKKKTPKTVRKRSFLQIDDDESSVALTQNKTMYEYFKADKVQAFIGADETEDGADEVPAILKSIKQYLNIDIEDMTGFGRPAIIFVNDVSTRSIMKKIVSILTKCLTGLDCTGSVVVVETTQAKLGETISAFCSHKGHVDTRNNELHWSLACQFQYISCAPQEGHRTLKHICCMTLRKELLYSRFPEVDGSDGIYGEVSLLTNPPGFLVMADLTEDQNACPSLRAPYLSYVVERFSHPLDVIWDLTGGFRDDRVYKRPLGFATDPERKKEITPLDHTAMLVAASKNRYCTVITPALARSQACGFTQTKVLSFVLDSMCLFLNRVLAGQSDVIKKDGKLNHLRGPDTGKQIGKDGHEPPISKQNQETIFSIAWDTGVMHHTNAGYDGLFFLPTLQQHEGVDQGEYVTKLVNQKVGNGLYYNGDSTYKKGDQLMVILGLWTSIMSAHRMRSEGGGDYILRSEFARGSVFVLGHGSLASKINAFGPPGLDDVPNCERLAKAPNVAMVWDKWTPVVKALKEIRKGDQLLVDYGPQYEWNQNRRVQKETWKMNLLLGHNLVDVGDNLAPCLNIGVSADAV